jgi:catechol 2,3-dioxygenase-like lactoylglutathione lyase family enzyme
MFQEANVTVMVTDMKRAVAFYRDVLGMKVLREYGGEFAEIEAPGLRIGLHPGGKRPLKPHARHMSIGLRVADMEEAVQVLEARGLELGESVRDQGLLIRNFVDPDGNPLYLVEVKWG